MNALSTFLPLPGSVVHDFHNASRGVPSVPVAPGSETRAKRRRGRPWGRQIYTVLSAQAEKALGRTVSHHAEVLRSYLIRRAGDLYPGFGELPWTATLAWFGVSERHFRRLLGELRPTFQWKKVGARLFYWSPFLADDARPGRGWTNLARFNGLLALEDQEVPFIAEVRAHYELERRRQRDDRRAPRRGRGGKNIGNLNGHPMSELRTSETAKNKPSGDYCRDLSSKRIPEEEISRPARGSLLERLDLDREIDEKSGISSLTGGGPEEPERPRVLEGVEKERAETRARPRLAKASRRPLAATETRPSGGGQGAAPRDPGPPVEPSFAELRQRQKELLWTEMLRLGLETWEGVKGPRGS